MDFIKSFMGGKSQAPIEPEDSDFADFAAAPAPSPVSIPSSPADSLAAEPTGAHSPAVYTKWYRVWERSKPSDFLVEAILIPIMILAVLVNLWGTRQNKRIARKWMAVHAPVLDSEFALVGYHGQPKLTPYPEGVQKDGMLQASAKLTGDYLPPDLLKEKSACEFQTYATGRQNVAFVDMKVLLKKRFNPPMMGAEFIFGLFVDSMKPAAEKMEALMYTFDGKEKDFVPPPVPGSEKPKVANSSYDGFVFAIVNKMNMRKLRDERYDVSLTFTKDNPKLPVWATVMSESAEVTETMLTKELIAAIEKAGEAMEYLIITDQPVDKPTTLDETIPKKRLALSLKLPSNGDYTSTLPLFHAFLRLPDYLASSARFRPEVLKKVTATRETESRKLKKVADEELEDERRRLAEKGKKDERDRKLKGMNAEDQKKFLEREKEKDRKKMEKKMSRKG